MSRVWILLLVLITTALQPKYACAQSGEIGNDERQEEYDDDFMDEHAIPALEEVQHRISFDLEHRIDMNAPFTPRGVVEIVTSASTTSKPKITFSALPSLSNNEVKKMKKLLRDGHHYTVRAKADPTDPNSPYIMTSVPMCMLVAMRLREDFAFHLSDSGKLVAIEYLTPYLDVLKCAEYQESSFVDVRFGPFGTVLKAQTGPSPPKNIVVKRNRAPQGVEPVKSEDGNDDAEEETQSFFRKYWYIILPIVVMSLFGGGSAAPAGGPDGAQATPASGSMRR
ncbi:unnamed protein product [Peronospora belbahrii]|nr:unnamed protein product [Peronospora belbahrii]